MIVGVDPGLNGGIVTLDDDGGLVDGCRMPTLAHDSGRRYVSPVKLRKIVRRRDIEVVGIEWVWAFPGEAASIAFAFGSSYGTVWGAFGVLHPVELLQPQKWKRTFGLPGGEEGKEQAREMATEMWPEDAELFTYKKDGGVAEAALIAEHLRRNK